MAQGNLSCRQYSDLLIRRIENLDEEMMKDITPTAGWIGHVSTGIFKAEDGVEHTFDRINRVFPDLSGCWSDVEVGSCVGTPCDPDERKIGFGSTRDSYKLQQKSWASDLYCYDLIMSADRVKQEFAGLVDNLKDATSIIMSERMKTEALRIAGKKIVASTGLTEFTFTTNADCTRIVPSVLPTSTLQIQMLQRQIEPLKLNGYFGKVPGMPKIVELVTDEIQGFNLVQGNPTLANLFRFSDFVEGGDLYKYGIVNAVGNFGFRYDDHPMRFQLLGDGITLERVYPYVNVAATKGIKGIVNDPYVNARYQIDFLWHRMGMQNLVADNTNINPLMPFAKRDFGGKWQFVQDNLGADANGCVIENKRRNKGQFIADFKLATKAVRPEWIVAILYERQIACVTEVPTCNPDPGYVTQDYSSANDPCPNPQICFDLTDIAGPYQITAEDGTITCNGVPVDHEASGSQANYGDLAVWLNANADQLGTWSASDTGICLDGSTCNSVDVIVVNFA